LEFKPHRDLYEWFISALASHKTNYPILPKQREFARLNLSYTIMSKRKLAVLVENKLVEGWDDPRMPTISGLRRRGYTPKSIREFINKVGVAKRENVIDVSLLEFCIREDLNKKADRKMVVLDPVKLTITNYPEEISEVLTSEDNPESDLNKKRNIPFNKHLYIEREDFKEEANRKFFRLTIGKEVRLKSAYIIKGTGVLKDELGNITEVLCEYDPKSKSGSGTEESLRKVKGTLHWVTQKESLDVKINSYDRLFKEEAPGANDQSDFLMDINPDSLKIIKAKAEPSLDLACCGDTFQFQRKGYFTVDKNSKANEIVFNKTVGLRDSWKKK
jgi:glutaminyl-tRNA synthetase